MRKLAPSLLLLASLGVITSAQPDTPALPRVPKGFDEGRTHLVQEASDGLITPQALVERLFEYADLPALASFIHLHLDREEKAALDKRLEAGGKLTSAADTSGVIAALKDRKPGRVASAIGMHLADREYTTLNTVAWLAQRGFNLRAIQQAMNGERIDAFRVMAAVRNADAAKSLTVGAWEYNLLDSREEKGGHYDGVQLVETMLALGFEMADFEWIHANADKASAREMTDYERTLVRWGDPVLIWETFEARIPESTLFKAILRRHEDTEIARTVAVLRAETTLRWFRTGGAGVQAVYQGPWPDKEGAPVPPTREVLEIGRADVKRFAESLSEPILTHFARPAQTLTVVVYEDGSSRALLDRPTRDALNYGPGSPFGNVATTRQCYEGRVSLRGRNSLMYLVYNGNHEPAPAQYELVNVQLTEGGGFFVADIDDGLNLTPILLRRVTRLVK